MRASDDGLLAGLRLEAWDLQTVRLDQVRNCVRGRAWAKLQVFTGVKNALAIRTSTSGHLVLRGLRRVAAHDLTSKLRTL